MSATSFDYGVYNERMEELAEASRLLETKRLTASVGGNLSMRVSSEHILVTPTNIPKGDVAAADICVVDYAGNLLFSRNGRMPTSETPFHTMIMRKRADTAAVVHAHATALCAFSIMSENWLEKPFFPEMLMEVGPVITVPYAEPSCGILADKLEMNILMSNGFLLQNHGALALSPKSPKDAVLRMEMMESTAQSVFMALSLGGVNVRPQAELEAIKKLQERRGLG